MTRINKLFYSMLVIAALSVSMAVLSAASEPVSDRSAASVTKETKSPTAVIQKTDAVQAERVVKLLGKSTYGLSEGRPVYAVLKDTSIPRARPLLQPPVAV